jgi:hypothetical protein
MYEFYVTVIIGYECRASIRMRNSGASINFVRNLLASAQINSKSKAIKGRDIHPDYEFHSHNPNILHHVTNEL